MADGVDIAVKLKEQREIDGFRHIGSLDQHTIAVLLLLQDVRAEPLRNESQFQVTGIPVVGARTEIHDAISIERGGFPFRIEGERYRARDRHRLCIGKCAVVPFGQDGGMHVLQVVFHLILLRRHYL